MKELQINHTCVFLGGFLSEDETMCIGIVDGSCYVEWLFQYSHEETDNMIMFNLNHAVKYSNYVAL